MSTSATCLGGTASSILIHRMGFGTMHMTWTPNPLPDDKAFAALKTAVELTPADQKLFVNAGEFYGHNFSTTNLTLLARFFTQYPELADRVFLSVKGGFKGASPEALRESIDNVNKALAGTKRLDLYETARVDKQVGIEQTMRNLKVLIDEGKFDHVGLSEVSAASVRKAHAVHPVAAVEIEVSPWSFEEETKAVIATTRELNIPVIAYSPLGGGFLTGKLTKDDLAPGDIRHHLPRYQEEAAAHNNKIVDALSAIAQKKGVTNAQLCLAWIGALGSHLIPIPGSSNLGRIKENFDALKITLSEDELKEITNVMETHEVHGGRYGEQMQASLWG